MFARKLFSSAVAALVLTLCACRPAGAAPDAAAQQKAVAAIEKAGGKAVHLLHDPKEPIFRVDFSDDNGHGLTDDALAALLPHLKALAELREVNLGSTKVTDVGVAKIADLKDLTAVGLDMTKVTDAGLGELARLKDLRVLHVAGTKGVTDKGIAALKKAFPEIMVER